MSFSNDIRDALGGIEAVESVEVELVFSPPWSPDRLSDDARFVLGVYSG